MNNSFKILKKSTFRQNTQKMNHFKLKKTKISPLQTDHLKPNIHQNIFAKI